MNSILERLQKELQDFEKDPPPMCSVEPTGDDPFRWTGSIIGPDKSPFKGGVFFLKITFPNDYPLKPPAISFDTPIFHPNIISKGTVGLDILRNSWSPDKTISQVFLAIVQLLKKPEPDTALVPNIMALAQNNRPAYEEQARIWTQKYAM